MLGSCVAGNELGAGSGGTAIPRDLFNNLVLVFNSARYRHIPPDHVLRRCGPCCRVALLPCYFIQGGAVSVSDI
jgi:hypothetical protein